MELDDICFQGKKATLIRPVELHEDGFNACYNYFDDGFWENAGYSRKSARIWSGKVGGTFFIRTVAAAYCLQEHYMDGVCVTLIDREPLLGGGSMDILSLVAAKSTPCYTAQALHLQNMIAMDLGMRKSCH